MYYLYYGHVTIYDHPKKLNEISKFSQVFILFSQVQCLVYVRMSLMRVYCVLYGYTQHRQQYI